MNKSYIENHVDSLNEEERCALSQEEAILDATELIWKLMEEKKISRTELAQKMRKRKSAISRLLSGERNLTIGKYAEILYHLNEKPVFETLAEFQKLKNNRSEIISFWKQSPKYSVPSKIQKIPCQKTKMGA